MVDTDTFLTILYVMVDDFCKTALPPECRPGPAASLTRSAVLTLALMSQWPCFESQRAFYRYAQRHWRGAFPSRPERTQFNRLVRRHANALVACFGHLVEVLQAQHGPFEVLDGTAAPTRDAKRRGHGWLPGLVDSGWSKRLGWYEGFHVLITVNPSGVITGFGFGAASAKDQPLAESFFAARHSPHPRLASVGAPAQGVDVADKGFEGQAAHQHWQHDSGAVVICPPKRNARHPWRRWLAGIRQSVETVNARLPHTFGLLRERPPALDGFQARLAAKVTLHNFCIWLNEQLGRPRLAFADLVAW